MRSGPRSAAARAGSALALGALLCSPRAFAQQPVPATSQIAAPAATELLEHSAVLQVTVDESQDPVQTIQRISVELGAKLVHCDPLSCTLGVPLAGLRPALRRLALIGRADPPQIEVVDLSEQWWQHRTNLDSLARTEAVLRSIASKAGDVDDRLELEERVERVRMQTANETRMLRALEERGRTATIRLVVDRPLRAPGESIEFRLPIRWLAELGPDHLFHPPQPYRRSTMIGDLHFALSVGRTSDGARFDGTRTVSEVSFSARMSEGGKRTPVGYALGLDLGLGGAGGPAFVYDLRAMLGPGLTFGNRTRINLIGGIGSSGITGGPLPAAGELPIELNVATDLGRFLRVIAYSRAAWVVGSSARQSGSKTADFTDEWVNGGWLSIGERRHRSSDGLGVGFQVHEAMGGRMYTGMVSFRGTIYEGPQ